jgi:hypothetical protein
MNLFWDCFTCQRPSFSDTFGRMVEGNHTSQAAVYQGLPVRWWRPRTAHEAEMYQASSMGAPLLGQGDNTAKAAESHAAALASNLSASRVAKAGCDKRWRAAREAKDASDRAWEEMCDAKAACDAQLASDEKKSGDARAAEVTPVSDSEEDDLLLGVLGDGIMLSSSDEDAP